MKKIIVLLVWTVLLIFSSFSHVYSQEEGIVVIAMEYERNGEGIDRYPLRNSTIRIIIGRTSSAIDSSGSSTKLTVNTDDDGKFKIERRFVGSTIALVIPEDGKFKWETPWLPIKTEGTIVYRIERSQH